MVDVSVVRALPRNVWLTLALYVRYPVMCVCRERCACVRGAVVDGVFLVRARWVRKMKKSMRCPEKRCDN